MIRCVNLEYVYPRSTGGLREFCFDDATVAGGVCGIFGKNGAGKSTFIRILSGVLHQKSGMCVVHGHETKLRRVEVLQNIGLVPEEFDMPHGSVRGYAKRWSPFYDHFDPLLFTSLLSGFSIPIEKRIENMSFGEKKKVLISFVFATRAKLLVFDEPTNGFDIPGKLFFKQLVRKYLYAGQRILIATHQVQDIEQIVDAIVIIEGGKCLLSASISDITQRFYIVKTETQPKNTTNAIFSMRTLDGYATVKKRTRSIKQTPSIDLELFFSVAVAVPEKVKALLPEMERGM